LQRWYVKCGHAPGSASPPPGIDRGTPSGGGPVKPPESWFSASLLSSWFYSHTPAGVCHLIPCTADGWRCQKAARRPQRCDRTRSWAALRGMTASPHCRIRAPNSPTAPCLSESTPASAKVHHPRLQVNATRFNKLYARSNAPSEAIALVVAAWRCAFKLEAAWSRSRLEPECELSC
jgi:hypothetical protein